MKCTFKCIHQVYELAPPTCVLKILIESMLLARAILPCVKEYGHVSLTPNGSNCSPYISAKSLDCSLHICLDRKYMRQFLPNDAKV